MASSLMFVFAYSGFVNRFARFDSSSSCVDFNDIDWFRFRRVAFSFDLGSPHGGCLDISLLALVIVLLTFIVAGVILHPAFSL